MKIKGLILFILLCSFASLLNSQEERSVRVNAIEKKLYEVKENRIVTISFRVTNNKYKRIKFSSTTKLPENWRLLTGDLSFEVKAKASEIKLISFYVPWDTPSDKYEVTYIVEAEKYKYLQVSDFQTVHVEVLPVTKLEMMLLESPEFVIAGGDYEVSFVITNDSNKENTIIIDVASRYDYPFIIDAKKFKLKPGEAKNINIRVKTDRKIKKMSSHHLKISAKVLEKQQIQATLTSRVDIIPRITETAKRFNKIPSLLSVRATSRQYGSREPKYDLKTFVYGEGTLDKAKKHRFIYRYSSLNITDDDYPTISDKLRARKDDRFFINYWTDDYKLRLGDCSYGLSSLAGGSFGRGAEAKVKLANFTFGCWYNQDQRIDEKRAAGYASYSVNRSNNIRLNYLNKSDEDYNYNLGSINGRFLLFKNNIQGEIAAEKGDEISKAYLFKAKGEPKWFSYLLDLVHTDRDFHGSPSYENMDLLSANIKVPLGITTNINSTYGQRKKNLDPDFLLTDAYLERYFTTNIDYDFEKDVQFSLGYRTKNHEDLHTDRSFDYNEGSIILKLGQRFKMSKYETTIEFGRRKDKLKAENQISQFGRYGFGAHLRPNQKILLNANAYYSTNNYYSTEEDENGTPLGWIVSENFMVNLGASFQIADRTTIGLGVKKRTTYNIYEMSWEHTLPNYSTFSFTGSYITREIESRDEVRFIAEYSIPFGMPIGKKKSIGMVKGLVYDERTKKPIVDAVVSINGFSSVTDEKGLFTFRSIKPGSYYVGVKTTEIGANLIMAEKKIVKVKGGKKTWVEVGITEASSITGQVMVYKFENGNNFENGEEQKLVESYGLVGAILEVTNAKGEVNRVITNGDGRFEFFDLHEGKWILKIYDYNLPEYHYFEKDTFELELKPSEKREILIKVLPKKRKIQMLEEGGTIIEEEIER